MPHRAAPSPTSLLGEQHEPKTSSPSIRELSGVDEARVNELLLSHPETTMFLRSNLARAGFGYEGAPYQGTYVGAFDAASSDGGVAEHVLVGIAAHYWNGNIILAAGTYAAMLTREVARISKREVRGFLGPHGEVVEARRALESESGSALESASASASKAIRFQSKEILFALDLAELVLPRALLDGSVVARPSRDDELPMLLEWRMAYAAETMGVPNTPEKREEAIKFLSVLREGGNDTVLFKDDKPVAYSALNAALPDIVQVGGVWTPPELRGRGYARSAVAASLDAARARGVTRAILFTGESNHPAQRCYAPLGFRPIGDYGLAFYA